MTYKYRIKVVEKKTNKNLGDDYVIATNITKAHEQALEKWGRNTHSIFVLDWSKP